MSFPYCSDGYQEDEEEKKRGIKWWAFSFDFGRRIGVVAMREDTTSNSASVKVADWNKMDEAQQAAWLRGAVAWIAWKLEDA